MPLKALAINCTLKASPAESSCDRLISETLAELERCGGNGENPYRGENTSLQLNTYQAAYAQLLSFSAKL